MKKLFTSMAMLALVATGASAQWTPSDKDFTVFGTDSCYNGGGLKSLRTPQGNVVVTWYEWPKGLRYDNPVSGYYLHLQIYDKNGKAKFQKGGLLVSERPTPSSTTDYGLSLADNGDIVLGYFDTRNDATKYYSNMFAYRYTQDGQPVWSADGIVFTPSTTYNRGRELAPQIVVSGDNIYFGCHHTESYLVKADSTNWEPSPWDPEEPMPDSITVSYGNFQLQCLNADGTAKWAEPKTFETENAFLYTAPEGDLYMLHSNAGDGLDAERINAEGNNVWGQAVNVENESLSGGMYYPTPVVENDGQGGLMIAYRKLTQWTGYVVLNRLQADGTVFEEATNCNGTTDGDGDNPKLAVQGDRALVIWAYKYNNPTLMANQFTLDGDYTWEGDSLLGYTVAENEQWGISPVKVIPQQNGWVMLYGDAQSWNGANFYVEKIDFDGRTVWKKQIAEDDFKSSGFSIAYDAQNAYIFYTCDKEIGDDWEKIDGPGGFRMMVVDITDGTNGIAAPAAEQSQAAQAVYYNAQGMQVDCANLPGLYLVKQGNNVKKVIVK